MMDSQSNGRSGPKPSEMSDKELEGAHQFYHDLLREALREMAEVGEAKTDALSLLRDVVVARRTTLVLMKYLVREGVVDHRKFLEQLVSELDNTLHQYENVLSKIHGEEIRITLPDQQG